MRRHLLPYRRGTPLTFARKRGTSRIECVGAIQQRVTKPIRGRGAALDLPTRRRAFNDDTAGKTVMACLRSSQAAAR
jgi:hypothetical protein